MQIDKLYTFVNGRILINCCDIKTQKMLKITPSQKSCIISFVSSILKFLASDSKLRKTIVYQKRSFGEVFMHFSVQILRLMLLYFRLPRDLALRYLHLKREKNTRQNLAFLNYYLRDKLYH